MGTNMQRLGDTLTSRMKRTANAMETVSTELGIINENLSLSTDGLQNPIPRGEYMVNLMLTGTFQTSSESHTHDGGTHTHGGSDHSHSGGSHSHSGGSHSHSLPSSFRGLRAGDRVLVVWCGNEPIVMAIVVGT